MKKMIITGLVVVSGFIFAQQQPQQSQPTDNPYVYDEPAEVWEGDTFLGNPGDPVPVDRYVPLLLAAAVGMVIVFAKRGKIVK